MNLKPSHIKLNGQVERIQDLLQMPKTNIEWRDGFYSFLSDWYSEKDFIEVQTSGSTGTPKIIKLKKDFVAASAQRTINFFRLKENEKVLHCLPSNFIAGKLMIVRAIIGRLDLHLIDPANDFELLGRGKFTFAAMVPTQVLKLFQLKSWNLEQLLIGGDAIPLDLEQKLQSVKTECYSSYGMTETATHIALRKLNGADSDSFYHCLGNIHISLSEDNCLKISIPDLSEKYLQTTDIAELKDSRTFKIIGRSDNVIISGGIKYSPETLERKLEKSIQSPFLISSRPHPKLGQQLVLIIEAKEHRLLQADILRTCTKLLSEYEQPRQIIFVDELPKTKSGKIIRK